MRRGDWEQETNRRGAHPFDQPVATAPSSAVLRVSSRMTTSPFEPITCAVVRPVIVAWQ